MGSTKPPKARHIELAVAVASVAAIAAAVWGMSQRDAKPTAEPSEPTRPTTSAVGLPPTPTPEPRAMPTVPAPTGSTADWDPSWDRLPGPPAAADRVRDIYTFAARRPDVVRYIPCFCGCSRSGHTSVESCFIKERDPTGKPKWNPMGLG